MGPHTLLLVSAEKFAVGKHGTQMWARYPYEVHLRRVAATLRRYGFSPILQAVGWLHDVREDTDATRDEVAELFGEEIAELVELVTDEPGKNRKERKAATYKKTARDWRAVAVKLCDREVNFAMSLVSHICDGNRRHLKMYVGEYPEFKRALYDPTHDPRVQALWKNLDGLYFTATTLIKETS